MKIVYIANARLPTEKAHGYQIVKMCEAFSRVGAEVQLLHPFRYQSDPQLKVQDISDYYDVDPNFTFRTLTNLDIVPAESLMPTGLYTRMYFIHSLLWGLFATTIARRQHAAIYYTRDVEVAYWLVRGGLPTVLELHSIPKRAGRWLLRRISNDPALSLLVTLTSFIKARLVEMGFSEDRILVSQDAVDLSQYEHLPDKEQCRQRLGLPINSIIIGYLGRFQTLDKEKGIPELIRAMAQMPSVSGKQPLLLCVGGPIDVTPNYLDLASSLGIAEGQLRFIDRVPNQEVPIWIRSFDLAVAPFPTTEHYSYFMSPLKIFEYMASEVPIVASDLPSLREVLTHGQNAWLVNADNPQDLSTAMTHVLKNKDLSSRLSLQAREDVTRHTWTIRAKNILDIAKATPSNLAHQLTE